MRDLLLWCTILATLPAALVHPWVGTMAWTWLSLMNPHRLTWGSAFDFPFAASVALATLAGLFVTKDYRRLPINAVTKSLMAFIAWICITAMFAQYPELSADLFKRVMKIQLMVLVTLAVLHTRKHVEIFVWIIVLSIGFFGLKGGVFTLLTGGHNRVWGPPGSYIEDNNSLALAVLMIIPLMRYLYTVQTRKWVRYSLVAAMILCALSTLGSQSRGALLGVAAMAAFLWLRSPGKLAFGFILVFVAVSLVAFMPSNWDERMASIQNYEQDSSAMGRINAWAMAWNLAKARPIGGGLEVNTPENFARYAPDPNDIHAAHSIYFEVLGEHGFLGLWLFLLIWYYSWRAAKWTTSHAATMPEMRWAGDLVTMVQVGLIGYFVGGAFLSLAYYDLPYDMMIVIVICRRLMEQRLEKATALGSSANAATAATSTGRPMAGDVRGRAI